MESSKNTKVGTIVFALMNGSDNIESCLSLANVLQEKGFKIVFAIDESSAKLIDKTYGYDQQIFDCQPSMDFYETTPEFDLNSLNGTAIEKVKNFSQIILSQKFEFIRKCEPFNQKLVETIRPELIIIESLVCSPALTNSGIPWVWLNFGPPNLCKNDSRIPPGWSGLTIQKPRDFIKFKEQWNQIFNDLKNRMNNWMSSQGAPYLPDNIFHPHSPYLNFYVNPTELDYKLGNTWEMKEWQQIDCLLKRKVSKRVVIPECLRSKAGRLIYLSMGKFASLELMKRLTTILSESANKFIVSKGRFHNEYELPENMWGTEDIPINNVIQSVDLVINCGDNYSITQCFLNAKPIIVLPIFADQLDNRTRLKETGYGWGLDPFTCNKETLICMIESTLDDKPLARRLMNIANSMSTSQANKQMANEIENVINGSVNHNKSNALPKSDQDWQNLSLSLRKAEA